MYLGLAAPFQKGMVVRLAVTTKEAVDQRQDWPQSERRLDRAFLLRPAFPQSHQRCRVTAPSPLSLPSASYRSIVPKNYDRS